MSAARAVLGCVVAGAVACSTGPRVDLAWTGADTGSAVLPALARRCGAGPVELTAMSGDTGIGFVIYGPEPLVSGAFPLTGPNEAASSPPAAALAARWLDSTEIFAYRAAEGRLELTVGRRLDGTFTAKGARWGAGSGEVTFEGAIHGVPVGPCEEGAAGR
ncbi:MAG TPA: hypothetical protein VF037_10300 [Gemmatimonadales bacterium]